MKKKRPGIRFPKAKPTAKATDRSWHNGGRVIEIGFLYARSLQNAAKTLIATLDLGPNPGRPSGMRVQSFLPLQASR